MSDTFWSDLTQDFESKLDGKISFQEFKSYMVKILEKHSSEPRVTRVNVDRLSEGEEEDIYSDYSDDSMILASEVHD